MPLFKKSSRKKRLIVLYRCHAFSPMIVSCYDHLMKKLEAFHCQTDGRYAVELYIIGDNLQAGLEEILTKDHEKDSRYTFKSEFLRTYSKKQEETLISGNSCTPQHYTLYITSINICKSLNLKKNDMVFFVEDDYKLKEDALEKCLGMAEKYKNDFIAPFDHPDRYAKKHKKMEDGARESFLQGKSFKVNAGGLGGGKEMVKKGYTTYKLELIWEFDHHWRSVISTCHTFICAYSALVSSEPFLFNADVQRGDHVMWTHIWATGKSKIWSPVPGLARHEGHKAKTVLLDDGDYE